MIVARCLECDWMVSEADFTPDANLERAVWFAQLDHVSTLSHAVQLGPES